MNTIDQLKEELEKFLGEDKSTNEEKLDALLNVLTREAKERIDKYISPLKSYLKTEKVDMGVMKLALLALTIDAFSPPPANTKFNSAMRLILTGELQHQQ